jgi:glutathione S-transferase
LHRGIPPNDPQVTTTQYTIPTLRIGNDYIVDSRNIADAIEKEFPAPSLRLDAEVLPQVEALIPQILGALRPEWMPKIPRNVLGPGSVEYWHSTRSKARGMPLDQYEKEEGGEKCYIAAEAPVKKAAALLKQTEGPFFLADGGKSFLILP